MKETFNKGSNVNKIECKFLEVTTKKEHNFPFRSFTEYTIFLNMKTKCWKIRKRYSDFVKLHEELSQSIFNLPSLPEKKLFQFRNSVIEKRKTSLEIYLDSILSCLNLFKHRIVLKFIELEIEILYNQHKSLTLIERDYDTKSSRSSTFELLVKFRKVSSEGTLNNNLAYQADFFNFIDEEKNSNFIDAFLNKIDKNKEMISDIINDFWLTLTKDNINLNKSLILKLFYGDGTNKGLFFHCGDQKFPLGAESCLLLLYKLINFYYNPQNELYIACLRMASLSLFSQLNLKLHLLKDRVNIIETCFNILEKYDIKNTKFESILNDKELIDKYLLWKESINTNK